MSVFEERRKRIIDNNDIDAVVLNDAGDIYYFSGMDVDDGSILVVSNDGSLLFTPFPEDDERGGVEIKGIKSFSEFMKTFKRRAKIGVNEHYMNASMYEWLGKRFAVKKMSKGIFGMRSIKDRHEIDLIMSGIGWTEKLFSDIRKDMYGVSEKELAKRAAIFAVQNDMELSFKPIIASEHNSANIHHRPSERIVENGDNVIIDMGLSYNHYSTDVTRTLPSSSTSSTRDIYEKVKGVHDIILDDLRPGTRSKEINEIYKKEMKKHGFKIYHACMHSIGIEVHEPVGDVIRENMILCIEPGVYFKGKFGVRIEDMILVKKDKIRVLTNRI